MNALFPLWSYRLGRISLALVFIGSGSAKILDVNSFAVIIDSFGILPEFFVGPVAWSLPILEIVAGLGLLTDVRGSLGAVTAMLVLFMMVLGYGLYLGLDIDCGCFGPEDPEAEAFHGLRPALYRDFGMMAGISYLYLWRFLRAARPVRLVFLFNVIMGGKRNA